MSLKKQATTGLVWTFAQQFGNQALGFVVSLILARVLLPEEFGVIGMITVFIGLGKALVNSGLTQSLIRRKEITEVDLSTIFYFNLFASILVYCIIYLSAPLIAEFYNTAILKDVIRVFGITFVLTALAAVQGARFIRDMNFKIQALMSIPSTVIGGIVGISMAYSGYGVWSLVWSSLSSTFASTIQLWYFSNWKPKLIFSFENFKSHYLFGYKLTLAGLLGTLFNNIYTIVIGKFFNASLVGFYTRAQTVNQLPVTSITTALDKVTYPMFSKIQDDQKKLKSVYKLIIKSVLFLVAPVLITMAALGEPLFRFLFTEKWVPAVPYFQILCITGLLLPLEKYNLNILKVKGRSDIYLKLELVRRIITVIIILLTIRFGIYWLLIGQSLSNIVSYLLNSHYSGKFIDYTTREQIVDISPSILFSLISGLLIFIFYLIGKETFNDFGILIIGGTGSLIIYLVFSWFFNRSTFQHFVNLAENFKKNK